jgi:hypothetical protein
LAKVEMGSAEEFYERLEEDSKELVTWKGELVSDICPSFHICYLNFIIYS